MPREYNRGTTVEVDDDSLSAPGEAVGEDGGRPAQRSVGNPRSTAEALRRPRPEAARDRWDETRGNRREERWRA